jgi:hypothetical protein
MNAVPSKPLRQWDKALPHLWLIESELDRVRDSGKRP